MTLKRKIAVNVSVAFSILFGLVASFIYINFSTFRRDEFKERLEEKAQTTVKLITEGKGINKDILKRIDVDDKLYHDKTLIFNSDFKLIYSSYDKSTIDWTQADLEHLRNEKKFFRVEDEKELLGVYFEFNQGDYYVLVTAEDKYGYAKMKYLLYMSLAAFFVSILLVWIMTYFFIKNQLQPLDIFQQRITSISANELNVHLEENNSNDELNLLTKAFNQMLTRLENSFAAQKEFTANASHELYTPLTRISLQLENLMQSEAHSQKALAYLNSINNDVHQIADLVSSLLILAKSNQNDSDRKFSGERIDEIIFDADEQVKKLHPGFNLEFDIRMDDAIENPMELNGVKALLNIVFFNLLKNANLYSDDHKASVIIRQNDASEIHVTVSNTGKTLSEDEQKKMFDPFMRGANSSKAVGSGLGLSIVKRILDYHHATLTYKVRDGLNEFAIRFPI